MASRKNLKKNIHLLLHEVAMEAYVGYLLMPEIDDEKFGALIRRIYAADKEFVARANHPSGTKDAALVRKYYRVLVEEFNAELIAIVDELKNLTKK